MPYIIGFVSQKGGVGKSTLARAAATKYAREGYRVQLCDLDIQQGTITDWYRRRLQNKGDPLTSVQCFATVEQALKSSTDLKPAYDVVVIDAPGRSSDAVRALAKIGHVLIQPTSGTLDDLDPAIRLFHELRNLGIDRRKLLFALMRTTTEHEEQLARDYIQQAGYRALSNVLYERAGYKTAQNQGLTIIETTFASLNQRAETFLQEVSDYIKLLYS
jgi:chromosome partitioning protein